MSGFEDWSNHDWARLLFALGFVALGLIMAAVGPFAAARSALKAGRVDAGGRPVYERGRGPGTYVAAGLGVSAIGLVIALHKLHKHGVL